MRAKFTPRPKKGKNTAADAAQAAQAAQAVLNVDDLPPARPSRARAGAPAQAAAPEGGYPDGLERRIDNGQTFTFNEFYERYGRTDEWKRAAPAYYDRAIWDRALGMLQCHRQKVPTLLGLSVIAVARTPGTQAQKAKEARTMPYGLQKYITKVRQWAGEKEAQAALLRSRSDEEEVTVVGERTFAQRDAECRKRAIDLEAEAPRNRGRGASGALEERVVSARSVCTAAIDKRVRELAQPALDEYFADRIDAAELDRRKAAAREKATAEHAPPTELERASAEYSEAVSARTKAEAAEDAAEAKLEAVLRELERGQPGPSGVKAE